MKRARIIPRLDIKGPNVVKGVHLEGLRVLGDPSYFARKYDDLGADELVFMDVVASLYERNNLHDIIARTARNVFIPITVGGGIRTLDDIRVLLGAGADKIAVNTAAVRNPEFVRAAAREFGASTIVVAIEAIRQPSGEYHAFIDNGREETGREVAQWARQAEELGAGEIMITSVDREGTGQGFDLELIDRVHRAVTIPVIAHGGPGTLAHVLDAFESLPSLRSVALASVLHYGIYQAQSHDRDGAVGEGNREFAKSGRSFAKIAPFELSALKSALAQRGTLSRKMEP